MPISEIRDLKSGLELPKRDRLWSYPYKAKT